MSDAISDLKQKIGALAQKLERRRQLYIIWLLCGIGVASFAMTFLLLYINPKGIDLRYTVTFGAFIPSAIIYLLLSRSYTGKARNYYLKCLHDATGFTERKEGCFEIAAAAKHKILPDHNNSRFGTCLQGVYKGVPVAVQEVILTALKQDPRHKKKQKEYLRFWGLLVRIQLSRPVPCHTVAIPRTAMQTFFRNDFSLYQQVRMPEGRFASRFEVLSTDPAEARFTLNAGFRTRFIEAGKALNVYWSEVSILDSEILMAFQRFRPLVRTSPLWKPVTAQNLRQNAEELESLTAIIDALKANPQVGI